MKKEILRACLIVFLLVVLPLSNSVTAHGPPIGEQVIEFSPSDTVLPNESVTVTIKWWITDPEYNETYYGPFRLKIGLKDDSTDIDDWKIHTTEDFGYPANELNPYTYVFTKNAPNEVNTYTLEVQILATDLTKDIGQSGKVHSLLVASAEDPITTVPEFSTIAIPVASILGLLFFFNHRKRRREQ